MEVTVPMVAAMMHSIGKHGRTAVRVRAALLYLAGKEGLKVRWKVEGRGGKKVNGVAEAQEELGKWLGQESSANTPRNGENYPAGVKATLPPRSKTHENIGLQKKWSKEKLFRIKL